jgi:hypothetical protein
MSVVRMLRMHASNETGNGWKSRLLIDMVAKVDTQTVAAARNTSSDETAVGVDAPDEVVMDGRELLEEAGQLEQEWEHRKLERTQKTTKISITCVQSPTSPSIDAFDRQV